MSDVLIAEADAPLIVVTSHSTAMNYFPYRGEASYTWDATYGPYRVQSGYQTFDTDEPGMVEVTEVMMVTSTNYRPGIPHDLWAFGADDGSP